MNKQLKVLTLIAAISKKRGLSPTAQFSTLVAVLTSVFLCAPDSVQADYGSSCGANAWAFVNTMGGTFNTTVVKDSNNSSGACSNSPNTSLNGQVNINAVTSLGPTIHTFSQSGSSSASGHASVGSLGAVVTGGASSTPMSYFYTDTDGFGRASDNNYQASAGGSADAQFWDTLFINPAPDANPGDKVEVKFTLDLHGNANVTGNGWVTANSSLDIQQGFIGVGNMSLSDAGSTSVVLSLYAYTVYTPYSVTLFGILDLNANALAGRALGCSVPNNIWCTDSAQFGNYFSDSYASGSFGSTASFYIDVLTPGASFTSESGVNYLSASPVPVPAAAWLFASGLLGLVGIARRKRVKYERFSSAP